MSKVDKKTVATYLVDRYRLQLIFKLVIFRRGERRMHFDGNSFIVRNAGHSAGFDDKNQLKVY